MQVIRAVGEEQHGDLITCQTADQQDMLLSSQMFMLSTRHMSHP